MEKRVERAKNEILVNLKSAYDLRDKYYEEAERKSKEACSRLTDNLRNIVKELSDNEVLELGVDILEGNINKEYIDIILIVLGERLSNSDNVGCSLLGMLTITELAKKASGDKNDE